ncbi:MAG: PilZ domain-containing protein [Pirellulales bacterium]
MTHRPWLDASAVEADPSRDRDVEPAAAVAQPDGAASNPEDRRVSQRRPHRVFQWIAPCIEGRLPDQSMFYQVQCIDISRTGISFYIYEPLPSDDVIIAIGTTADAVYVRSRVANCVRLEDSDGVRYRVGCELLERMGPKRQ